MGTGAVKDEDDMMLSGETADEGAKVERVLSEVRISPDILDLP